MKIDGINLINDSDMTDAVIESGTTLPIANAQDNGRLFYLTQLDGTDEKGLYIYSANDVDWNLINDNTGVGSSGAFVVTVHTTASTLIAGVINELQTGNTFTLPLANTVNANISLVVELPNTYDTFTPTIQCDGSDTISYEGGSDTSFQLNTGTLAIRFTSDGSSVWRI